MFKDESLPFFFLEIFGTDIRIIELLKLRIFVKKYGILQAVHRVEYL